MFSSRSFLRAAFIPLLLTSVTAFPQATSAGDVALESYDTSAAATSSVTVAANASEVASDAGVIEPTANVNGAVKLVLTSEPIASNIAATVAPVSTASYGGPAAAYYKPGFVPKGSALVPALSQSDTNGNSHWGLLNATRYGHNLPGPQQGGSPWGGATANNTNYYDVLPNTGVTRTYDFTVSQQTIAPDGVEKPGLVVNGGFPGPLIEANWGDWITVTLHNALADEGTSLHWHGLLQKKTPYYDGVPAVQQCPIAPGQSFTYTFRADLYGTSWYHSHYSAQYAGGAVGPMIIHGPLPDSINYDEDLGPIVLGDWYHSDYFSLVEQVMAPAKAGAPPPASNNSLINGKNNYPCLNGTTTAGRKCTANAGLSKFQFESGKKYRLRLINTSADAILKFSVDNHQLTVFANDFVQIQPYSTNVVTLGVGQRSDVVIEATGKSGDAVWMRSNISASCSVSDHISTEGKAVIYYENANTTASPTTNTSVTAQQMNTCANDPLQSTTPYQELTATSNPATTEELWINFAPNSTDPDEAFNVWTVNDRTFRADYNDPVLLEAKLGHTEFPDIWNVHNFGSNNSIRLVVYNNVSFSAHPMHMHGHNMFIIAEGTGKWDGSTTNMNNPQRRDVQLVQPGIVEDGVVVPSYIVVQINADNPGVWPFHCHIAWHVSGGLYINMLERPADIRESEIPMVMAQTCRDWTSWTNGHMPNEIDSGL